MNRTFAEIAEEALTLPASEQLRLARTLLEKSEASGDIGVDAAWEVEIERRIHRIESGRSAESVAYYDSREPGLGMRFRDEVASGMDRILRYPEVPRLRSKGYRRVNLRIFPHYIAYVIREETIWVVAIAHGYRRPEFWIERI